MKRAHGGDIYSFSKNIIDFSSNINPLGIKREIISEIKNSIYDICVYPDIKCNELRYAISRKEGVDSDFIICGNGAAELIFNIVLAVKPKTALFTAPTFSEYEHAVDIFSAKKKYYTLKERNSFDIREDIIDYIDSDTDIVFICNPNNPTGRRIKKELILKILNRCEEVNTFVVIDECFMDFVYNGEKYSSIDFINDYDNFIILKAFTKMYALPGLRLGYAICKNKRVIENIYLSRQPWNVSSIAQNAGIAALRDTDFIKETIEYILHEKEYIQKEFKRLGVKYFNSDTKFILFKNKKEFDKKIIEFDILIRNCGNYRGLNEEYYRIAIKRHDENIKFIKAVEILIENDFNKGGV